VIGDLGHAKSLDNVAANADNSNRTFGTNNYMAPEADEPSRRTIKMDIWSFGCILYELFYLEKLFLQKNPKKLNSSIEKFNVLTDLNVNDKIKTEKFIRVLKK